MDQKNTSWGKVADWYEKHLSLEDTYHTQVILPNLIRLIEPKGDDFILDLACGNGFFTKELALHGANVVGVDVAKELIDLAKEKTGKKATFRVSSADKLDFLPDETINKISLVLAIQNIEPVKKMLGECFRVLSPQGKMIIVMNHPCFRIPRKSSWQWDEKTNEQYRRVDSYLSESRENIIMNPGENASIQTISFHRPLQYYFKLFANAGFLVGRLEEWISHKKSAIGPKQKEEDRIRKEIPLFLCVELIKNIDSKNKD